MGLFESIILGLVQGLTEFLPVSSSGHLVLARDLLGLEVAESPAFEVVVHIGTLASILLVMRPAVMGVVVAFPLLLKRKTWPVSFVKNQGFRHLVLLIPATIPTVLVGLLLKDQIDEAFGSARLAAAMLLVTGCVLLATKGRKASVISSGVGLKTALIMGIAQSVAIIPGISRSGSTIATGTLAGCGREQAGTFSFLMAIPAVLGAAILHSRNIADSSVPAMSLFAGFLTAFGVGSLSLVILLKMVKNGKLWLFAPYVFIVGLVYLISTFIS